MDTQSILILILVVAVIGFRVIQNLKGSTDGQTRPGDYGAFGAVICPQCGLPYGRKIGSLNLLIGSLNRCPQCGKFAVLRQASPEALAEAEAKLAGQASPTEEKSKISEEEKLQRELDASKYEE